MKNYHVHSKTKEAFEMKQKINNKISLLYPLPKDYLDIVGITDVGVGQI